LETQSNLAISSATPFGSPCILNLCSHLVEFYDGDELLVDKVAGFLNLGLVSGGAAVAIVENQRLKPLEAALRAKGVNVEDVLAKGQLKLLDANTLLARLIKDGAVDSEATQKILRELLEPLQDRFGKIQAYGEMVSVLWGNGNARATLQLEQEWNLVCDAFPLTLLCGYSMKSFENGPDKEAQHEIFSLHNRSHFGHSR